MNGTGTSAGLSLSASPSDAGWQALGMTDLDGDGHTTTCCCSMPRTGPVAAWYLMGETVRFGAVLNPDKAGDPNWKVVGPR